MKLIRSSGGVVCRKVKDKVFVLLLNKNKGWYLPKGRINKNETPEVAALREVYEETNIIQTKLRLLNKVGEIYFIAHQPEDGYATRPKIVSFFLMETNEKNIKPLKKEGFIHAKWFEASEALSKVSFVSNKIIVWKAIKILESNKPKKIDTLVIAAGGKGERISSYFNKIGFNNSKSLFPIDGKSILERLLDNAINFGFKRVFVLTSFYTNEIGYFIRKKYPGRKNIFLVDGGKEGQEKGPAHVLYLLKDKLKSPFIYSDGNLLYKPDIFAKLSSSKSVKNSVVGLSISPKDGASTHLKVLVQKGKIFEIDPRIRDKKNELLLNIDQNYTSKIKPFFSMGVVTIDHHIFDLVPDLGQVYDFDVVIENLFKSKMDSNLELVGFTRYDGDWAAVHSEKDIDKINRKVY